MTALDPGDFAFNDEQAAAAQAPPPEATTDWLSEPGVQEALTEGQHRAEFDPERLAAAVHTLTLTADELNTATLGCDRLPWTDLVVFLNDIRKARKLVAALESTIETKTAAAMADAGVKDTEVPDVGAVTWRAGKTRKEWQHDALARDVIDHHMTERDGEVPDPYEVRDWLLDAAAVSYWRVTKLRALGLDPEDYAVSTPGRATVQISGPDDLP